MTETFVENIVCMACGTEVRPEALFCYHCGGPVAELDQKNKNNHHEKTGFTGNVRNIKKSEDTGKLRSASSLRNRARNLEPQKVEIIWEPHQDAPNMWFVAITLILTCLAVLIYLAAIYLR